MRGMLFTISTIVLCVLTGVVSLGQSSDCGVDLLHVAMDSSVRVGRLSNGFRYYVVKTKQEPGKVHIELVVKAGSRNQRPGEFELAHLIEHLGFEGTKRFPGDSLVQYLSKKGLKLGAELNAYTGERVTGYSIKAPSSDPALLANCIAIARDWAQDMSLDSSKIEAQKSVVRSEHRTRNMSEFSDIFHETARLLLNNRRLGISGGDSRIEDELMRFSRSDVVDFYKRWYVADRQAIIISGDVDFKFVESHIIHEFSSLHSMSVASKIDTVGDWKGKLLGVNRFIPFVNPEISQIDMSIYYKRPHEPLKFINCDDYRRLVLELVTQRLVENRFKNIPEAYRTPSVMVTQSPNLRGSGVDVLAFAAKLKDPIQIPMTCRIVALQLQRIREHGFSDTEFKDAILQIRHEQEAMFRMYPYINRLTEHFSEGINFSGPANEAKNFSRALDSVDLSAVNSFFYKWFDFEINRDVIVKVPRELSSHVPEASKVNFAFRPVSKVRGLRPKEVAGKSLDPFYNTGRLRNLKDTCTYSVIERDPSRTVLRFRNGATVVFLPKRKSENGQIVIKAFSRGGAQMYTGTDRFVVLNSAKIVARSGLPDVDGIQMESYLSSKSVSVRPSIGQTSEQIDAKCPTAELETALQSIFMYFDEPRCIRPAFEEWLLEKKFEMLRDTIDPDKHFQKLVAKDVYGREIFGKEYLRSMNHKKALRLFKERFSGARDFTFFIFGDLTFADDLLRILRKYIGNIAPGRKEEVLERNLPFYGESMSKEFFLRTSPKADVVIHFPFVEKNQNDTKTDMAMEVLKIAYYNAILKRLRTEGGDIYSPAVDLIRQNEGSCDTSYRLVVGFDCQPSKYKELIDSAIEVFMSLGEKGPSVGEFRAAKAMAATTDIFEEKPIDDLIRAFYCGTNNQSSEDKMLAMETVDLSFTTEVVKKFFTSGAIQRFVLLPKEM